MFDFEKIIIERTQADPEQFMKSGSYLYLRSGLIERWNTLNEHHTYPHMIKRLNINQCHQHLFLPKNYTGSPINSVFTARTLAETQTHLAAGWGAEAIEDLQLVFLYGPEPEVSGE